MNGKRTMNELDNDALPLGTRVAAALSVAYAARKAVLLEGPTGIGKSAILQQVAEQLSIELIVLDLSLLEPPDLVGLPVIDNGRTTYATPAVLPQSGKGIIVLEELNRAEPMIQQPALQLLTARTLHGYELPSGWSIAAAINPDCEDYRVTGLDRAMTDRFMRLRVKADRGSWLRWARAHRVHHCVIHTVETHDRLFDDISPRVWTYVSDILHLSDGQGSSEETLRDVLAGYLPAYWAEAVVAAHLTEPCDPRLEGRRVLRLYHHDARARVMLQNLRDEGRTDVITHIVRQVHELLKTCNIGDMAKAGDFSLAAFEMLLDDLPGDQAETLQHAFAGAGCSFTALDVAPARILDQGSSDEILEPVKAWLEQPRRRHRAWSFARGVAMAVVRHPSLVTLRSDHRVLAQLGALLELFERHEDAGLALTLRRFSVNPIRASSSQIAVAL